MRTSWFGHLFSAACLSVVAACLPPPDFVDDAGFQIWCGERLCKWTLEEGDIARVSTWHDHDYGVELVGSPVLLSQDAQSIGGCIRVETVSSVAASAEVFVEVDTDGDGLIDWQVRVPPSEVYQSRAYEQSTAVGRDAVYFLRKSGTGRAVLARVRISDDCVGDGDQRR